MVILSEVLGYKNEKVLDRFRKLYNLNITEVEGIFEQMLAWLWLAGTMKKKNESIKLDHLVIDQSLIVIDEMWHNFILFTEDYFKFCNKYFGYYLHHQPTSKAEEEEHINMLMNMDANEKVQFIRETKKIQYEYVYDRLGESTFKKWYVEYHKKYSPNKLKELRL